MKRPKGMTAKTWKLHLSVREMNKEIVKKKMKNSLYVLNEIDKMILRQK